MGQQHNTEQFVRSLTACQSGVYAYILTLVPSANHADDILQETNVRLWENLDRYEPGTDFMAWACRVAYYQVLTHRKQHSRNKLVFSGEMLDQLAQRMDRKAGELSARMSALRQCLELLPERQRRILQQRYAGNVSVSVIADRWGQPVKTIYQSLYRTRQALLTCIRDRLAADSGDTGASNSGGAP